MKKFLRKIAPFVLFILILELAIHMAVDPYNVFHWQEIRDNGVEPNSNYIKMQYVLHNPDKFDSFLFGSSRTGFVNVEHIPEGKWYNMSYSEGLPAEHLENLRELIANDIAGDTPNGTAALTESIRSAIDADSLGFVTIDEMVEATEQSRDELCVACFDGRYPLGLPTGNANAELVATMQANQ